MVCVCLRASDALRAVVVAFALDAGLATALDAAGFLSKKTVIDSLKAGSSALSYWLDTASLSSSLSTLLPRKGVRINT